MPVLPIYGGPLKRDIIQMAREESGQADYDYQSQITPEEYKSDLRSLNAMMGEWYAEGIDLGYNFPTSAYGSANDESGIPHTATQVASVALVFRIFPKIGKTASGETRMTLARSMSLLRAQYARIPTSHFQSRTPRGAGNRYIRWIGPYYPVQCEHDDTDRGFDEP